MSLTWELEDAGHKVLGPVSSMAHAQRLAEQARPDLALIDIDLQRQPQGIEWRAHCNVSSPFRA
jgi:AmiR/NasT family two-component response regulator